MERKLQIEDLKNMGDGSFEKMQEEARKHAGGDTEKATIILEEMVLTDFLSSRRNTEATTHRSETESVGVQRKERDPKSFSINHTKKKLFEETELVEKDSRKLIKGKRVCSSSDEQEKRIAKKPKTTNKEIIDPPPELPDEFKNIIQEMNGTDPKLLIQKQVQETDLATHQRRFAIPRGELKTTEFLTREEHMIVDRQPKGDSIELTLLDPALQEFEVHFKRWKMGNSFTYNLTTGWLKVLENKTLKVDDWIQLWCFQRDSKSCLALVNLTRGGRRQVASSNGSSGCDGEGTSSGGVSLITQEEHQQGC
ncbi:B3 domain-containing protein At2g31420-like [Tripterygium wilfordii]|uniref:B3 domain-containing protein At2g31420-like n=1 Tax=Tripterygium wilfordii TaxID=458696 RepID=UPI0018F8609E|nr:B3 domain-containing protein At2g31420-like [Tripterygium wilfordii]